MIARRNPAVLLGVDRLLGLQLARILWRHGVPVVGVAVDADSHYVRTRAARRILPFARFEQDPAGALADLAREYGARPVLIPCLDELVWWLDAHREDLAAHADFLLADSATLALLGDKARFYRAAADYDLKLPATRFARTPEDLEQAGRELGFPLMIKPPRRSPAWMRATNGSKVLRVDDAEALRRVAPPLLGLVDELILQRWVAGGDDAMVSLFVCLDRNGEPLVESLVAQKLRQWPPDIGVGCLAVERRDDALVQAGERLLRRLGYVGPGSLQLKREAGTGALYVIEMNVRSALCFPLFEACGVETTLTHYCAAAGLPLPAARRIRFPGRKWICWKRDLASAWTRWRRGELTLRAWRDSLRGPKRAADLALDDPSPQLVDLGRKLLRPLRRPTKRA